MERVHLLSTLGVFFFFFFLSSFLLFFSFSSSSTTALLYPPDEYVHVSVGFLLPRCKPPLHTCYFNGRARGWLRFNQVHAFAFECARHAPLLIKNSAHYYMPVIKNVCFISFYLRWNEI